MSQKSREMERRIRVEATMFAVRAERKRCAVHVRAMIGILKRGGGQVDPWDRLCQALERIERGEEVTETTRLFAHYASLDVGHEAEDRRRMNALYAEMQAKP